MSAANRLHRNKRTEIRLTELELIALRDRAQEAGKDLSSYLRYQGLMRRIPPRLSKVSVETYIELGRIGSNLNQLTKATNTALQMGIQPPSTQEQLVALLELLHQIRREIAQVNSGDDESEGEDGDWEAN